MTMVFAIWLLRGCIVNAASTIESNIRQTHKFTWNVFFFFSFAICYLCVGCVSVCVCVFLLWILGSVCLCTMQDVHFKNIHSFYLWNSQLFFSSSNKRKKTKKKWTKNSVSFNFQSIQATEYVSFERYFFLNSVCTWISVSKVISHGYEHLHFQSFAILLLLEIDATVSLVIVHISLHCERVSAWDHIVRHLINSTNA